MIRLLSLVFFLVFAQPAYSAKLLVLGDSLSAGYQMSIEEAWPTLLPNVMKTKGHDLAVINGSISGDTSGNGLSRLPSLLSEHQPDYVLIELGANDGLRGFPPNVVENNLSAIIEQVKQQGATPLLMQIHVLPNYGKRYTQAFSAVYPKVADAHNVPLLPFFLEGVITEPQWMMNDGLHPKPEAQPWIADFVANELVKFL
ncbi:arylesterase [Vibrio scophthalmi]|uniref:arylesterase n=1 Tax=Vibrio scophthalmi TaxID=45658 RepID=UPI002FF0D908